jgi:urea transport system permease protein
VSVGGRGTLAGAALGAVLVDLAKSWLTGAAPEIWLFFLGGLFVLSTLVFPNGIVGVAGQLRTLAARRRIGPAPLPVDEPAAAKERA